VSDTRPAARFDDHANAIMTFGLDHCWRLATACIAWDGTALCR
jgi:hypothetical protein